MSDQHSTGAVPNSTKIPDEIKDVRYPQDLHTLAEVMDIESEVVKRTIFIYIDKQDDAWFGVVQGKRKRDVTVEDVRSALGRVPNTTFPAAYPSLTVFQHESSPEYYIKRPNFLLLREEEIAKAIPQMLLEEIKVMEFLKPHPHSNIVRYHGCRIKNGLVTGIVLDKHETVLMYYFREKPARLDVPDFTAGLRAGVKHLHDLGLAHNDLNPSNILVDKENSPIIIDLGSCRKFGQQLVSAGTPGWTDEDYETSERKHDETALLKIEAWLNEQEASREHMSG